MARNSVVLPNRWPINASASPADKYPFIPKVRFLHHKIHLDSESKVIITSHIFPLHIFGVCFTRCSEINLIFQISLEIQAKELLYHLLCICYIRFYVVND